MSDSPVTRAELIHVWEAVLTEQVLAYAVMRELVGRLAERSEYPRETVREIVNHLHACIDSYQTADDDPDIAEALEAPKERARVRIDSLLRTFDFRD